MGRKKKFGEESDFVSVRVPKSKKKEYRNGIKQFVEKKFIKNSITKEKKEIRSADTDSNGFNRFGKFVKEMIENKERGKED